MDSRATGLSQRHERLERRPFPSGSQPASGSSSNYLAHLQLRHQPGQRAVLHRRGVANWCAVPLDDSTCPVAQTEQPQSGSSKRGMMMNVHIVRKTVIGVFLLMALMAEA